MRLYHMPGSRSSRVLWALEEAGATYDLTFLTREEKLSDAHAVRHPLRRVPVLERDDGSFVFESAAIALYIGDAYPMPVFCQLLGIRCALWRISGRCSQ